MSEVPLDFDIDGVGKAITVAPGKAQLLIEKAEPREKDISFTFKIVAHEVPQQEGRTVYDYVQRAGKGVQRGVALGLACGIWTRAQLYSLKAAGKNLDLDDLLDSAGKVFYSTLVKQTYNGKDSCRPGFVFCGDHDPEAKDYPKHPVYTGAQDPPSGEPVAAAAATTDEIPF